VAEHFRFDAAKLRALLGHRAEVLWFDQIAAIVFADSRRWSALTKRGTPGAVPRRREVSRSVWRGGA